MMFQHKTDRTNPVAKVTGYDKLLDALCQRSLQINIGADLVSLFCAYSPQ